MNVCTNKDKSNHKQRGGVQYVIQTPSRSLFTERRDDRGAEQTMEATATFAVISIYCRKPFYTS